MGIASGFCPDDSCPRIALGWEHLQDPPYIWRGKTMVFLQSNRNPGMIFPAIFWGIIIRLGFGSSRTQKFFSAWIMDDHEIYHDYIIHIQFRNDPQHVPFIWNIIPGWKNLTHYHPYYPIIIHIPNIWVCLKIVYPFLPNGYIMIIIPFLNGYFIGNIPNIFRQTLMILHSTI